MRVGSGLELWLLPQHSNVAQTHNIQMKYTSINRDWAGDLESSKEGERNTNKCMCTHLPTHPPTHPHIHTHMQNTDMHTHTHIDMHNYMHTSTSTYTICFSHKQSKAISYPIYSSVPACRITECTILCTTMIPKKYPSSIIWCTHFTHKM